MKMALHGPRFADPAAATRDCGDKWMAAAFPRVPVPERTCRNRRGQLTTPRFYREVTPYYFPNLPGAQQHNPQEGNIMTNQNHYGPRQIWARYFAEVILTFLAMSATSYALGPWARRMARAGEMEMSGDYQAGAAELEQALKLAKADGNQTRPVAVTYNNLGCAYDALGRTLDGERAFKHSISIWKKLGGPECAGLAEPLNNLATLYRHARQWSKAKGLYHRSLEIRQRLHGADHPSLAVIYSNLGEVEMRIRNFENADRLILKALAIWDREPERHAAERAAALNNRAFLMVYTGHYADAGPLADQAIAIGEQTLGPNHPSLIGPLIARAEVDRDAGAYENAEAALDRALAICNARFGEHHPLLADVMLSFANLRKSEGRNKAAKHFRREVRRIRSDYSRANKLNFVVDAFDLMKQRGN